MLTHDSVSLQRSTTHGSLYVSVEGDTRRSSPSLLKLAKSSSGAVDIDALGAKVLAAQFADRTRTVFRGIRRVPVGAKLCIEQDGTTRWQRLPRPRVPVPVEPEEAAKQLRGMLLGAVERAISGGRKIATMGGGGFDSSALIALVRRHARDRRTEHVNVALDFRGPDGDQPFLHLLEDTLGFHSARLAPEDGGRHVLRGLVLDGAPFGWPNAGYEWALSERAKELGADVLLTGAGGDDVFDGDLSYFSRLATSHPIRAISEVLRLHTTVAEGKGERLFKLLVAPSLVQRLPLAWRRRQRLVRTQQWHPWARPRLLRVLDGTLRHGYSEPQSPDERYERFVEGGRLDDIADMRAQFSVSSGITRVDPFFDPELLSFVAELPPSWAFAGRRTRGLFREAMRPLLPESIAERTTKAAFEPALARMLQASGAIEPLRKLARVPHLADLELVEPRPFSAQCEHLFTQREAVDTWLACWPALAAEAFLSKVADSSLFSDPPAASGPHP